MALNSTTKRIALAMSLAGVLFSTGCGNNTPKDTKQGTANPLNNGPTGTATVVVLDAEAIYALPEFAEVTKKLTDEGEQKTKKLEADVKSGKIKESDLAVERLQMQQELDQERVKLLTPLQDRVHGILADMAKKNGYNVVLDKRIVVTGVKDITDDVKAAFAANTAPSTDTSDSGANGSGVGYVSEDTISDLTMFHDAQAELQQYSASLQKDFEKKSPKSSPDQRGQMQQAMMSAFNDKKAALYNPLKVKVDNVIAQVAKDQGLSLVLDAPQVMWGGKNITTDVIEKLVGKGKS